MTHAELIKRAEEAIEDMFSDTSVSPETTQLDLEQLRDEINLHLDALRDDRR